MRDETAPKGGGIRRCGQFRLSDLMCSGHPALVDGYCQVQLWTIGHSNRTLDQFTELLTAHQIQSLADVRRFPGSRRLPHFNQENLSQSLPNIGIEYVHFPELGGRRKVRPDSPNTVW